MDIVTLLIAGSSIIMGPVEIPNTAPLGAEAQIMFTNTSTNDEVDTNSYFLSSKDMKVQVDFTYNSGVAGADSIVVIPPLGWTCDPVDCRLELLEGYSGIIFLIPYQGA